MAAMHRSTWRLIFFAAILITAGTAKGRGGASTGGGDNPPVEHDSAWFLGKRVIHYCIESAPAFGVAMPELDQTFQRTFATWKRYTEERAIGMDQGFGLELALTLQRLAKCDGTEDLKLYFGVMNEETIKAKAMHENPSAFAHRTSYDTKAGWGKGFVWVAPPGTVFPEAAFPDWRLPNRLNGILLHELGHIFGCSHVERTIMTEQMSFLLIPYPTVDPVRTEYLLTHIDGTRELVGDDLHFDFSGLVAPYLGIPYPPDVVSPQDTFKRFVGRVAVGTPQGRFRHAGGRYLLTLSDDRGTLDLEWNKIDTGSQFTGGAAVFKMAREIIGVYTVTRDTVDYGTIQAADGKSYLITFERNEMSSDAPVTLHYFAGGKRSFLFWAKLPGKSELGPNP